ncbi:hypothetical protein BC833DRAFT_606277 [Globomyces pollinis-pini]|nr:hypothetical protein BC833DRAFT_606277 [Globomyces pollinis-pini]
MRLISILTPFILLVALLVWLALGHIPSLTVGIHAFYDSDILSKPDGLFYSSVLLFVVSDCITQSILKSVMIFSLPIILYIIRTYVVDASWILITKNAEMMFLTGPFLIPFTFLVQYYYSRNTCRSALFIQSVGWMIFTSILIRYIFPYASPFVIEENAIVQLELIDHSPLVTFLQSTSFPSITSGMLIIIWNKSWNVSIYWTIFISLYFVFDTAMALQTRSEYMVDIYFGVVIGFIAFWFNESGNAIVQKVEYLPMYTRTENIH